MIGIAAGATISVQAAAGAVGVRRTPRSVALCCHPCATTTRRLGSSPNPLPKPGGIAPDPAVSALPVEGQNPR